jgi:TRAP-type C4-dicarboxylate transport system permease small subunit
VSSPAAGAAGRARWVARLDALSERSNRVAEGALALTGAIMLGVVLVQVLFRYVVQASLSWSEELARYAFVWAIFLGASAATRRGQHIVMGALVSLLPAPLRRGLAVLAALCFAALAALLVVLGVVLMHAARFQVSTGLQVPISWVYAALPVGMALCLLHLLAGLARGRP